MKRKLLFLGCNFSQIPYLESIDKRNWEIVGVDLNENAPGRNFCDKFHRVGYDDLTGLIEVGVIEGFTKDDMVFTAAAQFAQKGAAHFAAHFKISFPSESSIDLCLDKTKYYDWFSKNNIPIPKTWNIKNKDELKEKIRESKSEWFYLKSDFSKNPHYVYRFNSLKVPWKDFFWGKDRYLREFYVLQEEFQGASLRINVYSDRFNVFDFITGRKTSKHHEKIISLGVIDTLKDFISKQKMQDWLIKFDIILNNNSYVVLDIGMDPPSRMLKESKENKIDFEKYYVAQYLLGQVTYPEILD